MMATAYKPPQHKMMSVYNVTATIFENNSIENALQSVHDQVTIRQEVSSVLTDILADVEAQHYINAELNHALKVERLEGQITTLKDEVAERRAVSNAEQVRLHVGTQRRQTDKQTSSSSFSVRNGVRKIVFAQRTFTLSYFEPFLKDGTNRTSRSYSW